MIKSTYVEYYKSWLKDFYRDKIDKIRINNYDLRILLKNKKK